MSEGTQKSAFDSVAGVVRELSGFGVPTVLWTVIFCVAVWRADATVLGDLFPRLYWTWIVLCGVSVLAAGIGSYVGWRERRRHKLVPVAVISRAEPDSSAGETTSGGLALR